MCYMQPEQQEQKVQEELEYRKRKRDVKPYIFFDLECTQDTPTQCEKGYVKSSNTRRCKNCKQTSCGTFKHVPNLCVAHKVSRTCMQLPLNKESQYANCGKNENSFAGEHTIDTFCKWLFSEENEGAKQKRSTEGCSKFKSPETRQVQERLVSTLEHMQVPKWDRTRCPEE